MNVTRQHRNCLSATKISIMRPDGLHEEWPCPSRHALYCTQPANYTILLTTLTNGRKRPKHLMTLLKRWYTLPNIDVDPLYDVNGGNVVFNSSQLIFERRNNDDNAFESRNLPIGFENGNSGNTPTQNLVDAYEMADGTPFSWENTKHASKPYSGRDPRFYKAILTMKLPSWVPK